MKKVLGLMTMLAAVVLMASVSFGQSISTTDYAFNTTAPSNYGPYSLPALRTPGDSIGGTYFSAYTERTRLTDGDYIFSWGQADGWDGSATGPYFYIIDLGSVKTDINDILAFNIVDNGSAISAASSIRVYGSTASMSTTSFSYWGEMVPSMPGDTTSWGAHMWSLSTTNASARYIFVNPVFWNDGWHKLFTEIAVLSIKNPVNEWYLY